MHRRWTLFLTLLAILVSVWSYQLTKDQGMQSILLAEKTQGQALPTYVGINMITEMFDENGQIQYEITAKKVSHFDQTGMTYFQMPIFLLFNDRQKKVEKAWQVSANDGILYKKDTLELKENVLIKNLQQPSPVERLNTAQAWIDLTSQDTYSHLPTTIFGLQVRSKSQGFSGNLKQKYFTLEKNVNTHYEIESTSLPH